MFAPHEYPLTTDKYMKDKVGCSKWRGADELFGGYSRVQKISF